MWQLFRRIPRAKTRFLWDPAVNYNAQPTIIIEDFWGFREEIHFFVDWHTLCTILNAMVRVEQALDKEEEAKCKA